jgi:hypothetical protein
VIVGAILLVTHLGSTAVQTQATILNSSAQAAQDRAVQSDLATEATTLRTLYINDNESYATVTPARAMAAELSLQVVGAGQPSTSGSVISLAVGDQSYVIAAKSASGTCWFEYVDNSTTAAPAVAGLPYGNADLFGSARPAGPCTADTAAAVQDWSQQFPTAG